MKLLTPPWKTAWYDDQISERFFQEMSRMEKSTVRELQTSAQWMNQLVIEMGQLAQHFSQLEQPAPHNAQIRLAYERALKLTALSAHLTTTLDRADAERPHTPVGVQGQRLQQVAAREILRAEADHDSTAAAIQEQPADEPQPPAMPLRQTVTGLSRRGLSVAEIEVITGQSRSQIEAVLNRR
jgi:hypothetical protein